MRPLPKRFVIPVIDEDRATAGGMRTIDIAPAIADQVTFREIDLVRGGGAEEHAGLWFPAIAWRTEFTSRVETNLDAVERWQRRAQLRVHGFDRCLDLSSATYIGLVRDDDKKKARLLQPRAGFRHAIIEHKLIQTLRRIRTPFTHNWPIQYSVAIEKDRAPSYFVLSHFVCATFSFGWLTKRCQTTAWNASECGVMFIGFTVGIIMHTSATCAV